MAIEREEQLQYIQLWEESGLTKAEFCRQMGIGYSNFKGWLYKLEHQDDHMPVDRQDEAVLQQIVPVSLAEDASEPKPAPRLMLHLKDSLLEIPPGFPPDELGKIIKLLRM